MATRTLLKTKPNPKLPLQILRSPTYILTRSVAPNARPEAINEAPSQQLSLHKASTFTHLGMTQKPFGGFPLAGVAAFARQMGTSRSSTPRGSSIRDEEEDVDDDDEEEDVNDVYEDEDDFDEDEDIEIDDGDANDGEIDLGKYEDYDGQVKENRGLWDLDDGDEEEEEEEEQPKRKKSYRRKW